jgi:Fanconi-associated nuclease 1
MKWFQLCITVLQGPYYEKNFLLIVNGVVNSAHNRHLFNGGEWATIQSIQGLGKPELRLFIRLYQRSVQWVRVSKLEYPDIAAELAPVVDTLVKAGLLSYFSPSSLSEALAVLSAAEHKEVVTQFRITHKQATKESMSDAIMHHARTQVVTEYDGFGRMSLKLLCRYSLFKARRK